jgi:endonuclease/exonuclease/phosphatase family metal-dependent hydrolase
MQAAELVVATHNIRHGAPERGWADHRAMARTVASLRADVVALQEVDRRVVRSWFVDQAHRAALASGMQHWFAPTRRMGPGGRYGNALLVRGRTLTRSVLTLPGVGEQRLAMFARVVCAEVEVTVVNTHLQNRRRTRPDEAPGQLDALLDELARWPRPWCVMGDLNLRAAVVEPRLGRSGLVPVPTGPTHPAHDPRIRIDWIAVAGLDVLAAEVVPATTSDHRPVRAALARQFPHDGAGAADARGDRD